VVLPLVCEDELLRMRGDGALDERGELSPSVWRESSNGFRVLRKSSHDITVLIKLLFGNCPNVVW
jgi:hypothetical protein